MDGTGTVSPGVLFGDITLFYANRWKILHLKILKQLELFPWKLSFSLWVSSICQLFLKTLSWTLKSVCWWPFRERFNFFPGKFLTTNFFEIKLGPLFLCLLEFFNFLSVFTFCNNACCPSKTEINKILKMEDVFGTTARFRLFEISSPRFVRCQQSKNTTLLDKEHNFCDELTISL